MFRKLFIHWGRLRFELGKKIELGTKSFRVRGYLPNKLATSFTHEPYLVEPLRRALGGRNGVFVDVGVNTGQTLLKVLSVEPDRRYIGFEPQIGCAFFVDQFLRDNHIHHAEIICLALGDCDAVLTLHADGQFDEMASIRADSLARPHTLSFNCRIPVRVGDAVLSEIGIDRVAVLKVDVEGAELEVFRGLRNTVHEHRPVCMFEVLPNYTGVRERIKIDAVSAEQNRDRAHALFQFFQHARYQIFQIDHAGNEHKISDFDLDEPASYVSSDYIAYPID